MADLPINLFDALVITVLLVSGFFAFLRGLTKEVFSIVAWVGAVVAVWQGYAPLLPYVQQYIPNATIAQLVTVGAIFLLSLIVLTLISHSFSQQVKQSAIGALDRSLGFLFGLARGALIVVVLYIGFIWFFEREQRPDWVLQARSLSLIETGADLLLGLVPGGAPATEGALALPDSVFSDESINAQPGVQVFRNLDRAAEDYILDPGQENSEQDKEDESGYKAFERRLLDRVYQTTQEE